MKRSQMLKRIREMLDRTNYDPNGYEHDILRVVEALGMLPPHFVTDADENNPLTWTNDWEPEDE